MERTGKVMVLTGEGKGKTTAALGLALRAVGEGRRVLIVQFLKAPGASGEETAVAGLAPDLVFTASGRRRFVGRLGVEEEDRRLARRGLDLAIEAMATGSADLIVLDEIHVAAHHGALDLEMVLDLIRRRPPQMDLILTGRYAADETIALADEAVEIKPTRHPLARGVAARPGIEY